MCCCNRLRLNFSTGKRILQILNNYYYFKPINFPLFDILWTLIWIVLIVVCYFWTYRIASSPNAWRNSRQPTITWWSDSTSWRTQKALYSKTSDRRSWETTPVPPPPPPQHHRRRWRHRQKPVHAAISHPPPHLDHMLPMAPQDLRPPPPLLDSPMARLHPRVHQQLTVVVRQNARPIMPIPRPNPFFSPHLYQQYLLRRLDFTLLHPLLPHTDRVLIHQPRLAIVCVCVNLFNEIL